MSLTLGRSPFASGRGSFDFDVPEHVRYWEPWPRRMRAVLAGRTILDSRAGLVVHETGCLPVHYFPSEDLDSESLIDAGPAEDGAPRWDVRVGDRVAETAVTGFTERAGRHDGPRLDGYVTVAFATMDRWFEEDDPIYGHIRDIYHRVDVLTSSQHVIVRHGGKVVAQSCRPKLLFETGAATRYYLPFADVDLGALGLSNTISECPYKGDGQHWHLVAGGKHVSDAAWSLPHPLPAALAAAEHLCFYPDKVYVEVDGEHVRE